MSFTVDWLALREPADQAARNHDLLMRAGRLVPSGKFVLDLGSGTGSTARTFAEQGFGGQRWRFLDNDPALLDVARALHPEAETVVGDLGDVDALPLDDVALVTASALLDLMPEQWVTALAARLQKSAIPFYAALSYDGTMGWTPAHPEDQTVTAHFNAHQRGNKGIGAALGPESGKEAARILAEQGFGVTLGDSPWILGPEHAMLQAALLEGIGAAAAEAGLRSAGDWTAARGAMVAQSQAVIGHTDLLAIPPAS